VWDELQVELAALSSNGKQVIAEESGHYIQLDQPELVIDAIRDVVEAVGR
jgi:pimeloyl-ACP methyl ester carboxylesterase